MISQTTPLLSTNCMMGANAMGANAMGANAMGANAMGANNFSVISMNEEDYVEDITEMNKNINACIICLEEEGTTKDKKIIDPKDLDFLIKNCSCHFYIHEKCFNLWYFQKPVCPICALSLVYGDTILPTSNYITITDYNDEYVSIDEREKIKHLRSILIFLLFFFLILFLFNIFYPYNIYFF
jgi:hypothetical protein